MITRGTQVMNSFDWQMAETIARELVNRETDVNELQKVITYVRIQTSVPGEKVGEKFFVLLQTMVRDGRFLMRSGRTLDYYRNLQSVCSNHLSDYRGATGDEGKKLVKILGWVARLMRYYNTAAGDAELVARQNEKAITQPPVEHQPQTVSVPSQTKHPKKQRQPKPQKPPVQTEIKEATVTLTTMAINRKGRVRTEQGEEIPCAAFPAYPLGQIGEICIAEVTRENGRAVSAIFRGWK